MCPHLEAGRQNAPESARTDAGPSWCGRLSKEITSTWPFIDSQGIPPYSAGTNTNQDYAPARVRGTLPNGMQVVVDNNIPTNISTNQNAILVVPQEECHLLGRCKCPGPDPR
jgi:hypothetical protein